MKFTVKDTGEIQKVVMKDEAKPTETPTETSTETPSETPETTDTPSSTISTDAPKTGDTPPVMFWILLAGLGMIGFGTSAVYLRKKRNK